MQSIIKTAVLGFLLVCSIESSRIKQIPGLNAVNGAINQGANAFLGGSNAAQGYVNGAFGAANNAVANAPGTIRNAENGAFNAANQIQANAGAIANSANGAASNLLNQEIEANANASQNGIGLSLTR